MLVFKNFKVFVETLFRHIDSLGLRKDRMFDICQLSFGETKMIYYLSQNI